MATAVELTCEKAIGVDADIAGIIYWKQQDDLW